MSFVTARYFALANYVLRQLYIRKKGDEDGNASCFLLFKCIPFEGFIASHKIISIYRSKFVSRMFNKNVKRAYVCQAHFRKNFITFSRQKSTDLRILNQISIRSVNNCIIQFFKYKFKKYLNLENLNM